MIVIVIGAITKAIVIIIKQKQWQLVTLINIIVSLGQIGFKIFLLFLSNFVDTLSSLCAKGTMLLYFFKLYHIIIHSPIYDGVVKQRD